MSLNKKIASAIATAALLANTALPVIAGTTIEISGNGTESTNNADVDIVKTRTVIQSNEADINNEVRAEANTGSNKANDNTGGDVEIDTGDADVTVEVANDVNSNRAELDCCGAGGVDVLISENGSGSDNDVDVDMETATELYQFNNAYVYNKVDAYSGTGDNGANDNTGGDVEIDTGDASTDVSVSTSGNSNSATVGNGDSGGSISAWIIGNGTDSDNDIDLDLKRLSALIQSNEMDVDNKVRAAAETGWNEANDNTGGDVEIDTGDAEVDVTIENMVNFNSAEFDCDCLLNDVWAKIAGNGSDTDNDIKLKLADALEVFQDNCGGEKSHSRKGECELENKVDAYGGTGENDTKDNTGDPGGDPSIDTGDADVDVQITNGGNSNVFGEGAPDWPWDDFWPFGINLNISLDLADLLG